MPNIIEIEDIPMETDDINVELIRSETSVFPAVDNVLLISSNNENILAENDQENVISNENINNLNPVLNDEIIINDEPEVNKIESVSESRGLKRKSDSSEEDDEEGLLCPICFEKWTNSGEHRLSSLICGHLFGYKCVVRWLSSQTKKTCPTCKSKASLNDLRFIYTKKLICLDTSELDRVKNVLDKTIQEKNRLQQEVSRLLCTTRLQEQKIEELSSKIEQFRGNNSTVMEKSSKDVRFSFVKSLDICKEGGCRVMDANADGLLAIGARSAANIFSEYGIRKIKTEDFTMSQFVPLHTKVIRDIAFHSQTGEWLLSASLDKTAKLINISNNSIMNTFPANAPLWSCCWDGDNPSLFYVGTQRGSILQYDIRTPPDFVSSFQVSDSSPIVSLACTEACPGGVLSRGAVLCCKLTSCYAFERTNDGFQEKQLPVDGTFVCLRYDRNNRQILVSTRPSQDYVNCRHIVCYLDSGPNDTLACNTVHCFQGGTTQKTLSRTCQISLKNDTYVVAYQETRNCINVWSLSTGTLIQKLSVNEPIMDVCHVRNSEYGHLVALSDQRIKIYQCK